MASDDPQLKLKQFVPTKKFFVGIDSDGCAFNSMEVKHNDCFSVALVREYGLAAVSRQVHEAWDFVNLYSQNRGCNRFKAILFVLDHLLRVMPRVKLAGIVGARPRGDARLGQELTATCRTRLKEVAGRRDGRRRRSSSTSSMTWSKLVNKSRRGDGAQPAAAPGAARSRCRSSTKQADVLRCLGDAPPRRSCASGPSTASIQFVSAHRRPGDGVEDQGTSRSRPRASTAPTTCSWSATRPATSRRGARRGRPLLPDQPGRRRRRRGSASSTKASAASSRARTRALTRNLPHRRVHETAAPRAHPGKIA